MPNEPEDRVADIVVAAGGRLVSRVRLQKVAYLLDKLGAKSGFSFAYHHFGPYSTGTRQRGSGRRGLWKNQGELRSSPFGRGAL